MIPKEKGRGLWGGGRERKWRTFARRRELVSVELLRRKGGGLL